MSDLHPELLAGDLYWANVVLLCHCDGTAGSTTFTDVSPVGRPLTAVGAAAVETTQVKAGTGAADITVSANSNNAVQFGGNLSDFDFQSGQFTMEAWVYATSAPNVSSVISQFNNSSGGGWFFGPIFGPINLWYWDGTGTSVHRASSTSIPTGGWHHVAIDRDGTGTLRMYLDGAVIYSGSDPTFQAAAVTTKFGNSTRSGDVWPGYIDEVRVTKGVARYAGAFTVPSAPFPEGPLVTATAQARALVLA